MHYTTTEDYITSNLDAFEQIEREYGKEFTDEQRTEIAQLALDGEDFYESFRRVTSLTAFLDPTDGQVVPEDFGGEVRFYDLVTVENWRGERLEKTLGRGGMEDGFYVEQSEDAAPYDEAAEKWLADLPGIWIITKWV